MDLDKGTAMIDLSDFFPRDVDLKTAERKALYTDILKVTDHCFANMPISFVQTFKRLFFQGELDGYGSFDGMEAFYICMSLPEASVEQYVKVLKRFEGYGNGRAVYMLSTWLNACVPKYPLQRKRWAFILLAIDQYEQAHPEVERSLGLLDLIIFLNSIFASLAYKGGAHYSLGESLFERANASFSTARSQLNNEEFRCLEENLLTLFSGTPKKKEAYSDYWFIEFCRRYFVQRDLSHAFLQFCENVYQAIPEEQRIRWQGDAIFVPSLQQ